MDELTPRDREIVQEILMRRWLQLRCKRQGRRRTDRPLPEVARHLSASQVDRLAKWCAKQERVA